MSNESFISRLAKHIKDNYDLKKQELTVVFPNKRAAFNLRSEFKKHFDDAIWLPQMLSIQEAVSLWSGLKLAENIDIIYELIDIHASLDSDWQISNPDALSIFGSQASQMAKDFDEIDQYLCDAKSVFNYVVENKKIDIWNFDEEKSKEKEIKYLKFYSSLYNYYDALRTNLKDKKLGYYGMMTRELNDLDSASLVGRLNGRQVIFAGFNALTPSEENIIDKLVKEGMASVIFDFDSYYVDDESNEAGLFARRYKEKHPNWMESGISDSLLEDEKNINIVKANGTTIEVKALRCILDNQGNPSQSESHPAIILADENLLIPALNSIPDNGSCSGLMVSMGYPLRQTSIYHLVSALFSFRKNKKIEKTVGGESISGRYIWPLYRIMDMEICKIIFTPDELDAYAKWKNATLANSTFIFTDEEFQKFDAIPQMKSFLQILFKSADSQTPADYLGSLVAMLRFIANKISDMPDSGKLVFLLNQVSQMGKIVNRLSDIVKKHADSIKDVHSVEILFNLVSYDSSIKLSSSSREGIQIMGLLETRNLDFDTVHLLGVNEGILPTDKSSSSFIPNFIKDTYGLPGYKEKQAVYAYHFYHLLQSSRNVYIYYNAADDQSGGEPSRFILQIEHELAPKNPKIHITEELFPNGDEKTDKMFPIFADKTPEVMKALTDKATATERTGLTPTSLSTYIACPLKFYLKYIVKLSDDTMDEDTKQNVIGTIIHKTLQLLYSDYLPKDGKVQLIGKDLFDKVIRQSWKSKFTDAVYGELHDGLPDIGFNYLNGIIMNNQIDAYLNFESAELDRNDLAVLKLEEMLSATIDVDGTACKISGIADRIDKLGEQTRIIDYKTGHVDAKDLKVKSIKDIRAIPEKALQLMIYKFLYLKSNPTIEPNNVSASIFGLKYHQIKFDLDVEDESVKGDFMTVMEDKVLKPLLLEMLDTKTPFRQTDNDDACGICDFKDICGKYKKKFS